jgi:caffeoyl-CoA O-methyltransferase
MSSQHIQVTGALLEYIRSVTPAEPELFSRLREETLRDPMARMQISPEQGALLGLLTRLAGFRRTLEIGVFTGYSSLWVASSMPEDGRLIACDISEEWTSVARRYWKEAGVAHKIDLRLAPALDTLDSLIAQGQAESFDFAFIDADKTNYAAYYDRVLVLLRPGGLVAVDNVLWYARVLDPAVQDEDTVALRAFNQKLAADDRIWLVMLPIGDGLTLAVKQ